MHVGDAFRDNLLDLFAAASGGLLLLLWGSQ